MARTALTLRMDLTERMRSGASRLGQGRLPSSSDLDSIGRVYANSFRVYSRFFTTGIPGITSPTEWFGIEYRGIFGVDRAWEYDFRLVSDDGAAVYIHEQLVVRDDSLHPARRSQGKARLVSGTHRIRVSYFQGARPEVALVLVVKPPKGSWQVFDTRTSH